MQDVRKATALLEHHIATYPAEVDLTHVNILAELQMDVGEHGRAAATIQHAAAALCPDGQLPIDLQVLPTSLPTSPQSMMAPRV